MSIEQKYATYAKAYGRNSHSKEIKTCTDLHFKILD
jgi:hypothetical protein